MCSLVLVNPALPMQSIENSMFKIRKLDKIVVYGHV